MAIRAETTPRDPSQEYVTMSRRRGREGEFDEFQRLFEDLIGERGEGDFGEEEIDWAELWNSFIGETEEEEQTSGPTVPTGVMRPFGSMRPTTFNTRDYSQFY